MLYKKTAVAILALLVSALVIFTACGSVVNSTEAAGAAEDSMRVASSAAPMMTSAERGFGGIESPAAPIASQNKADVTVMNPDRKIIKHSHLALETKEFDAALGQLLAAIAEQGGYIEGQSTNGQSLSHRGAYYERSASIQARIPADKLDAVTAAVGDICNVTSKSENIDDITDSYFDSQARLKSLQLQEERLLEILSKADRLEDVISLERALSDVRYQIESLTASIRRMDSQVDYSYLNLELREVVEYQSVSSAPKTLGEKMAASFKRSGEKLTWFFEAVLLFLIEDLPLIVIWLAIFGVLAFIAFKIFNRTKVKMHQKTKVDSSAQTHQPQDTPTEK